MQASSTRSRRPSRRAVMGMQDGRHPGLCGRRSPALTAWRRWLCCCLRTQRVDSVRVREDWPSCSFILRTAYYLSLRALPEEVPVSAMEEEPVTMEMVPVEEGVVTEQPGASRAATLAPSCTSAAQAKHDIRGRKDSSYSQGVPFCSRRWSWKPSCRTARRRHFGV